VLLFAATPDAQLPPKAKFAKGLDPALLDDLRRFVEMLTKPTVPESAVEEVPASPAKEAQDSAQQQSEPATGIYADAKAEARAKALRTAYRLGNFGAEGRLEGEDVTWTTEDLAVLESAFARTTSAVQTLVLSGLGLRVDAAPAKGIHTAEIREVDGTFMVDIYAQKFRELSAAEREEVILHEVGHGIRFRRPALLRGFTDLVRGDLSSEETLRRVGGARVGAYLVEQAAAGNDEYFAHSYAVFLLDPNRLPRRVREWAENNFP
jgi:hypothetical protein